MGLFSNWWRELSAEEREKIERAAREQIDRVNHLAEQLRRMDADRQAQAISPFEELQRELFELRRQNGELRRLLSRTEEALAVATRSPSIGVTRAEILELIKLAHPDKNPHAVELATKITAALNAIRDRLP